MSDPDFESVLSAWESDQLYQLRSARTVNARIEYMRVFFMRTHCDPYGITPEVVKRYIMAPRSKPLADGTRWLYQQHFRAYSKWLVQSDRRVDNPMEKLPPISKPRGVPNPVTEAQLGRLLRVSEGDTRLMILLAAFAGLRVHEIAKISGRDLDWDTGKLHVIGKRRSDDWIELHPVIRDAIRDRSRTALWFPKLDKEGVPTKEPIDRVQVGYMIKAAMIKAGVESSAHKLRHRYGTELLRQTGNIRKVQDLMRHTSIASTQVYTKISDDEREAAIASLPVPE